MTAQRKKVLVVGAGAAGMSCADGLSRHPERFDVTLVEATDYCGGQAFSIPVDQERFGASWLNQGVQGGSPIFAHTMHMFKAQGEEAKPVNLQVAFGKDETFWTNMHPTPLVEKHGKEIKRFYTALKIMTFFSPIFALMTIRRALKCFFFSNDFINYLVLPTIALFLGTGNATPDVPASIMITLFKQPTVGMWYPGDKSALVSNRPDMIVFPELGKFYKKWAEDLRSRKVNIRLSTEVARVVHRDNKGVKVAIKTDKGESMEEYDEIVFCVLADTALRLLDKTARWVDKQVLGSAKFSDDITVTHYDADYMRKRYHPEFDEETVLHSVNGVDHTDRVKKASEDYKPMYFIVHQQEDRKNPDKLDMAFDCSNYQSQLPKDLPLDRHIFQTIFLNKKDEANWTIDQINPDKIIQKNWWHQLEHRASHYTRVVPWMFLLNGKRSTTFAGSWTLVNAHEVAIVSGLSAAWTLGADYPKELAEDKFARRAFKGYNLLAHHRWYSGQ